jgi:hypothetical protein
VIKVDGSITANSSGTDNQGQVRKGADIIIGRDEETHVLAKSTDVSGAKLESQGGFVETSGDHLDTNSIHVKAAQWLLDPSDITISTSNDSNVTGVSPADITPNGGTGTSSIVKVDTIQNAINAGTSVTIKTTNASNATGAGNITIANALSFDNQGPTDATLNLIADNGITQSAGASITTQATSAKLVNINMTASGNYQGVNAENGNSKGIVIQSAITTNGDVTLDGTIKTTSSAGVYFGGGSNIAANKITVTGDARPTSNGNTYNGISFNGSNTFLATGSDDSTFLGKSSSTSAVGAGILGNDSAALRFTGNFSLDGQNTNVNYRGVRLGANAETLTVTTNGNVTFENSTDTAQVFLRGTVNLESGAVTFRGGSHIDFYNSGSRIIAANGTTVNLQTKNFVFGNSSGAIINTNGAANAGYTLNIQTDRLALRVNSGSESTVNVGTGTTKISTYTSGKEILIGTDDVTAGTTKLGLTNAELNRFTGPNLTIGDTVTSGNITVAGATTTNTTTGDITLQTAGNIAFSAALTVGGASATKALTLNAAGANSAITQTAAIKSTGLELLGANATYTLTNTGNDIKKIAGNTKVVSLTNNSAFAVDTVNTVGLTTSGNTTFSSTNAVTENQKLDTAGLELLGVGGSFTLTNTGNNVRKIAGNTGSVNLTNNSAFAIDTVNTIGLTTTGNTTFRSTAAVTQTQKVAAAGLELLGTGGTYTLTNAANSISTLAANTGALSFVNSDNFTVGLVNTSGINTTAGDITLVSANGINVSRNATSNGNDIAITANGNGGSSKGFEQSAGTINAGAGDVTIVGTTKTVTGWPNRIGANVRGSITGNNISITGTSDTAAATDGMGVQFEGASSVSATGSLTVAGEVKGGGTGRAVVIGNGMSTPTLLSGATGIDITGTLSSANAGSADNAGVFIEASGVTATSSGGAINITGDSTAAGAAFSKNAVFLKYAMNLAAQNGTTIEGTSVGTGASVYLDPEANINVTNGALTIQTGGNSASNAFIMSGANARITQATDAGVTLTTEGQGNITAPKIVNNGTGNVVIAAGSAIAAGTGTGGQVLTVAGNSITQGSTGKTYIYSGEAASTGLLTRLSNAFSTLYYQGTTYGVNTAFNTAYDGTPANDLTAPAGGSVANSNAQVFFRSNTKPGFALALDDTSKQYGDTDPTVFVASGGATTLTNAYAGVGGNNNFAVAVDDVIGRLTGTRAAGENVGTYAYTLDGSAMNTTLSAQPNLNITKRDITLTSVTAASKQYDGGTAATINGGVFANTTNGETLSLSGAGVFADPNAGVGKPVSVTDVTTLGLVDGTGVWSNYNLTSTGSASGTGTITKAPLTLTVNDSSVFVTQLASSAPNQGFSYSGFLNGDDASVFNSLPTRTYTGLASYPVAGTYNGVLSTSTVPTSTNYLVSVVPGSLTVTPADKLLITIGSQSATYGTQTAASAGVAAVGTVTAQYCFDQTNCNAPNLVDLTLTRLSASQWKAADNTGSYVVFDTSVTGAQASGSGYLKVGNYTYEASEIAPLSLPNGNFTGRSTNAGVLTITPLAVSLTSPTVSKAFDGTTALPTNILPATGLTANNTLSGDALDVAFVSGAYASSAASSAASFSLLGVQLSGADAANYSLANYANSTYTGTGSITGGGGSGGVTPIIHPPKPIIPTDNTSGGGESGGDSSSGNPYLLIPSGRPNSADRCTPNTLEDCLCETQEPRPVEGIAICYQPKKTASTTPAKGRRG